MPESRNHKWLQKTNATLNPVQATQLWTFEGVYSYLINGGYYYMEELLNEFFLLNREVLLNPSPFTESSSKPLKSELKEFSLRTVLYSGVTPNNIKDAEQIAELLGIDKYEVLRIICQTCKKIPERKVFDFKKLKSKLPDDREKYLEEERILLYCRRVLNERRVILSLVIELSNGSQSMIMSNLAKEILLSQDYIPRLIKTLNEQIFSFSSLRLASTSNIDSLIYEETILFITQLLRVLANLLYEGAVRNKEITESWFSLMGSVNFMNELGQHINDIEQFSIIQALLTIISILLLDMDANFATLDSTHYFNDSKLFKEINDIICNSDNPSSIVMYSWSIILLKKSFFLDDLRALPSTLVFSRDLNLSDIVQSIENLKLKYARLDVFNDMTTIINVLNDQHMYTVIISNVIHSAIPLIVMTPEISSCIQKILEWVVKDSFFDDVSFQNAVILSRAKFPILMTPYLNLVSIDDEFAYQELIELKSYATIFKATEFEHLYEIDNENTSLVRLTKSIDLYPPYEINKKLSLFLSEGTKAKILPASNSDEIIVIFLYKYNGWSLLGRVLQNVSKLFDSTDKDKTTLILSILKAMNATVSGQNYTTILESMSAYTDDSDIIEVILRLFEQALHSRNMEILESILKFLDDFVAKERTSHKVLPYISKSSLLPNNGKEGFASTIFGAIEMVNGEYKFSLALLTLIDLLVFDFNDRDLPKTKSSVLARFIRHILMVFESSINCNFKDIREKFMMIGRISSIFSNVLEINYGLTDYSKKHNKESYAESCQLIVSSFLITGDDFSRTTMPILALIDELAENPRNLTNMFDSWIREIFTFAKLIVGVRTSANMPPSAFEKALFSRLPQLVMIYAQNEILLKDVLNLLTCLMNGKWGDQLKPSMLSHLGQDYAQVLLYSLASDLSNSINPYRLKIAIYNFICSVLDANQEGMAVLFVNGKDLFGHFSQDLASNELDAESITLLDVLKKNVRDIKHVPYHVSVRLANTISLALNSWITTRENNNDSEFVKELIFTVSLIDSSDQNDSILYSEESKLKLIAKLLEILSLVLFTTKSEECQKSIIEFIKSDVFFSTISEKFKIGDLSPEKALVSKKNTDRFDKDEWPPLYSQLYDPCDESNYLNAQVSVAKSLGALLTTFCRKFESSVDQKFLNLIIELLRINAAEGIQSDNIVELYQVRLEVAFYISYTFFRKQDTKLNVKNIFEIVKSSSEILSSPSIKFPDCLNKGNSYYRPQLRILYCFLSMIKNESVILIEFFSVFRGLFELIIAKGIKSVLIELQNEVYLSQTNKSSILTKIDDKIEDLMLILSILKIFMSMKISPDLERDMAKTIESNGTLKSLLSLFSFSHLIEVDGEPIFAQLCLMFIQQLMKNEIICNKFVDSGLFIVFVQSSISDPLRQGGIHINSGPQFHKIWTNGILPIFLTSLAKLGPNVLPEVCLGLRFFGKQIEYCIDSWSKDSSSIRVTSATVAETNQILLLLQLLRSFNVTDYLNGTDDFGEHETNTVDISVLPGLDSESKREEFVECINNLLKHPKFLASRISASSLEEQRLIEAGGPNFDLFVKNIVDEIRDMKDILT
ncbi:uncharacterized protein PRCAT00002873001 [Priceomyces carsonii]|uniref:uncharacterized protein n=1 Tax=Priceomyces carsonii TaxID=28549 RepID=UPI002EDA0763|nr:unnamed protein product [Priceomyces carsonii]